MGSRASLQSGLSKASSGCARMKNSDTPQVLFSAARAAAAGAKGKSSSSTTAAEPPREQLLSLAAAPLREVYIILALVGEILLAPRQIDKEGAMNPAEAFFAHMPSGNPHY